MSTIVNLDITSSYDFFFDVIIPNISAYMADQCNMTAINAAASLWHMHEWHFNDDKQMRKLSKSDYSMKLREYREDVIFRDVPKIAWLRDIAEAGKHAILHHDSSNVKVKAGQQKDDPWYGFMFLGVSPLGVPGGPPHFEIVVDGEAYNLASIIHEMRLY